MRSESMRAGIILVALSIIIALAVFSLTGKLIDANSLLHSSCPLPPGVCPFEGYPEQAVIAYAADAAVFLAGLYLILSHRRHEKASAETRKTAEKNITALKGDEKKIYEIVAQEGAAFQSDIVEKSGLSKAKVSRILDRLEGRGILERKRRGMSNVIVVKNA